ncbi:sigma-70 family RNA polymerase sigma factor [Marinilabiliaceae bacterium ANBcel2]|nr:sigma-70 family RNA polymerase sigma factor [Marinilabiliaceae bacterium ANBcel2]
MIGLNEIIENCKKGKREAQKKLYELYAPQLLAVCIRYTKNREDAEDFLHEGFLKIFDKIDQYKGSGSIEGWMRRLMVNSILEEFRKNKKYTFLDESYLTNFNEKESDSADSEEDDSSDAVSLKEVLAIIEELPKKYQMVFKLYVLEEYSHNEIANQLNISIGTSKSNLSRARRWIKNRLEKKTVKKKKLWAI